MELEGKHKFDAAPEAVWNALLDPASLQRCLPGAKSVTGSAKEGFHAEVETFFGPIAIRFNGSASVEKMEPYENLQLRGLGRGTADISLEATEDGTLLSFVVSVQIGGRFGRLGDMVVKDFGRRLVEKFFSDLEGQCLAEQNMRAKQYAST